MHDCQGSGKTTKQHTEVLKKKRQPTLCPKCAQAYQDGIRRCMGSIPLWRSSARIEEKAGAVGKARAILEQARLKNPHQDELWLAAVRTEQRATNTKAADALMAKALQVCYPFWADSKSCCVQQQKPNRKPHHAAVYVTSVCMPVPMILDTYDSQTAVMVLSKLQTTRTSMQ